MGEDARLDDFVTEERVEDEASTTDDETTDDDAADDVGSAAGADGSPSNRDGSTAATGAAATIGEGPPGAVERTTYWRPEEYTCERCGATALRLWNEAGALVCSDCTAWQR